MYTAFCFLFGQFLRRVFAEYLDSQEGRAAVVAASEAEITRRVGRVRFEARMSEMRTRLLRAPR